MEHRYERNGKQEVMTFREPTNRQAVDVYAARDVAWAEFWSCELGRRVAENAEEWEQKLGPDFRANEDYRKAHEALFAKPSDDERGIVTRTGTYAMATTADLLASMTIDGEPVTHSPIGIWAINNRGDQIQAASQKLFGREDD